MIRDEKSPWHKTFEWSTNCAAIREAYIRNRRSLRSQALEKHFTNLRFNDQHIEHVDASLRAFDRLVELVLTCNRIRSLDFDALPASLRLLDVSGNYLQGQQPATYSSRLRLEHLGLALNSIDSFRAHPALAASLVSLDLSSNQIRDLSGLIDQLSLLKCLKNLILYGNPIVVNKLINFF